MTKSKILTIEDESMLNSAYRSLLGSEYELKQATNAEEGINLTRSWHPDIILLDIILPGSLNGYDVLQTIKNSSDLNGIPVVVFTNLSNEKEAAIAAGASGCYIKTAVSISDILKIINDHLPKKE